MTVDETSVLADFWVHDPFILANEADQTYYLYTSSPDAPVVTVYRSGDLRHWAGPTTVFAIPEGSWANPSESPWAPEVHEYEGRFYLFTTLHDSTHALPAVSDGGTELSARNPEGRVYSPVARGTVVGVATSPLGPFELLDPTGPVAPAEFMTLDGTLYIDESGSPWMVYAHEWVQLLDGTIEAIRLDAALARAVGSPIHLFRGSEAAFLRERTPSALSPVPYITDGPQVRRLANGALLMLWATYRRDGGASEYVETMAISRSGGLAGPWEQLDVLVDGNAGHGMLFTTFEGTLMLVLHRGMGTPRVRAELFEVVEDESAGLRVVADRSDLYA
ncbi:glycoside hydrolase family 43 protein [Microbacterium sp. SS28]|uniref:glycoside hydrolase family 43 protein n=1 Tax=Microbacterium sp. SS28 TaxID=2919948 RepID=UPI001FA9A99D|nr:glycoside hydrolase family 43 protein [Microbacterium sp. SS28]